MYVPTDWTATTCTADGCDRPRTGVFHTLCRTHYESARRQRNAELAPLGFVKGCSVAECDRPHHATGLCRLHYNRQITTGSTELKPKAPAKPKPPCSVEGCSRDAKTLGYCGSHYSNFRRHGVAVVANMRGPRDEAKLDKFARHLTADDEVGCWIYAGIVNGDGYAKFNLGQGRGEVRAHRWLYEQLTGRVLTPEVQLDHGCTDWDNDPKRKRCVRPSHLTEVDQEQHTRNTAARRAAPAGQWYKPNGTPRSLAEVGFAITHQLPMVWNR
ncbi:HNH endonuclease [Arthrobacter sp. I3]|uniref:HNH endonuclease n=1 Tax=Arthrobacter sp. I3 TaxID=218158 RepID=UPI000487B838|nr:HNH endonuclease [Arthrobacter sp. I3]